MALCPNTGCQLRAKLAPCHYWFYALWKELISHCQACEFFLKKEVTYRRRIAGISNKTLETDEIVNLHTHTTLNNHRSYNQETIHRANTSKYIHAGDHIPRLTFYLFRELKDEAVWRCRVKWAREICVQNEGWDLRVEGNCRVKIFGEKLRERRIFE